MFWLNFVRTVKKYLNPAWEFRLFKEPLLNLSINTGSITIFQKTVFIHERHETQSKHAPACEADW